MSEPGYLLGLYAILPVLKSLWIHLSIHLALAVTTFYNVLRIPYFTFVHVYMTNELIDHLIPHRRVMQIYVAHTNNKFGISQYFHLENGTVIMI